MLKEIRAIASAPIRYVVNSHWHWDHWYGTETYRRAFPDVHVVAHEETRRMMLGPAIEFNRPGPLAVGRLRFAVCRLPFAVCRLPFAVCR